MSKFMPRVQRRDAAQDHIHALPDGTKTQGALSKPHKDIFNCHTHLYEYDGCVYESGPAEEGGDHVHTTCLGDSSGPLSPHKEPGEAWKNEPGKITA